MPDSDFRIFVSYSRKDAEFAVRLANDLRLAGINIWIDQLDIPAGVPWDDHIELALHQCRAMLIVLSPNSIASQNVKDELADSLSKRKQVVPVLLAPCEFPLRLRRLQYIDFSVTYESGLKRLLAELAPMPPKAASVPLQQEDLDPKPLSRQDKNNSPNVAEPTTIRAWWVKPGVAVIALAIFGFGIFKFAPSTFLTPPPVQATPEPGGNALLAKRKKNLSDNEATSATSKTVEKSGPVVISSASCTSLGSGRFKVEMTGRVSGPVGATFTGNSYSDPGNEMGTVCEAWPDMPPGPDGYVHRVCQRRASDPGETNWKSSMVLVEKPGRPVKNAVASLNMIKGEEVQFLGDKMVPLSCQ